jgi:hypothetical protein
MRTTPVVKMTVILRYRHLVSTTVTTTTAADISLTAKRAAKQLQSAAKRANKTDPGNPNGTRDCLHADYMDSDDIDPKNLRLGHFQDPLNRYARAIPKELQQSIKIIVPPIRHADGTLVNPLHYGTVLSAGKTVAVDVTLRV